MEFLGLKEMIKVVPVFIATLSLSAFANASVIDNCVEDWPERLKEIDAQVETINDATRTISKDPYLASDTFRGLSGDYVLTHSFFELMAQDRSCQRRVGVTELEAKEKVELLSRIEKYSQCGFLVSEVSALAQEVGKIKKYYDQAKSDSEKEVLKEVLDERIYSVRRLANRYANTNTCYASEDFKNYLKSVPKDMLDLKYSL